MHYKKQLYAWITAMLVCTAIAVALGSCGSGGGSDGGGNGMADGPTATVEELTTRLVACGYTGASALTKRLQTDLSVASKEADGEVFPTAAKRHYEKVTGLAFGCMVEASCTELTLILGYCPTDLVPAEGEDKLVPCINAVEEKYKSDQPGTKFRCSDGTVLDDPADDVCDGVEHCGDASDESAKACATVSHITCDGRAAPTVWRCDSKAQCKDGADERNCFVCGEGEVTRNSNQCNGSAECGSGADERDCEESFSCPPDPNGEDGDPDGGSEDPMDGGTLTQSEAPPALHEIARARHLLRRLAILR